mmetsp:Transcript_42800/g.93432  ORF Transcript_42800/g.93432 Transcript_42800/m.93432 type:complete len:591 (-) Transcript_42800:197-1969(-)|eukprot:CAMPEP_0204307706 /NCGR_PEP_ID=MMETSP0469-20131031/72_1 /ASSEMBLY_ACC=CAM_ASM_000384 /TAXON_ID=2969 /ORGANISM="Oxyrrhis marina" /LENGTH=590 /DNA_ID=CAMNT_0051287083 /DNA_START=23 /DNA_END=1795 /DNA_ORIENTATION=+
MSPAVVFEIDAPRDCDSGEAVRHVFESKEFQGVIDPVFKASISTASILVCGGYGARALIGSAARPGLLPLALAQALDTFRDDNVDSDEAVLLGLSVYSISPRSRNPKSHDCGAVDLLSPKLEWHPSWESCTVQTFNDPQTAFSTIVRSMVDLSGNGARSTRLRTSWPTVFRLFFMHSVHNAMPGYVSLQFVLAPPDQGPGHQGCCDALSGCPFSVVLAPRASIPSTLNKVFVVRQALGPLGLMLDFPLGDKVKQAAGKALSALPPTVVQSLSRQWRTVVRDLELLLRKQWSFVDRVNTVDSDPLADMCTGVTQDLVIGEIPRTLPVLRRRAAALQRTLAHCEHHVDDTENQILAEVDKMEEVLGDEVVLPRVSGGKNVYLFRMLWQDAWERGVVQEELPMSPSGDRKFSVDFPARRKSKLSDVESIGVNGDTGELASRKGTLEMSPNSTGSNDIGEELLITGSSPDEWKSRALTAERKLAAWKRESALACRIRDLDHRNVIMARELKASHEALDNAMQLRNEAIARFKEEGLLRHRAETRAMQLEAQLHEADKSLTAERTRRDNEAIKSQSHDGHLDKLLRSTVISNRSR